MTLSLQDRWDLANGLIAEARETEAQTGIDEAIEAYTEDGELVLLGLNKLLTQLGPTKLAMCILDEDEDDL